MALTRCNDLSPADWLTDADRSWEQLVEFGPASFAAYGRLRFLADPAYPGQGENDVEPLDAGASEVAQLRAVLGVLARHTRTPEDCYFCLWEGFLPQVHPLGAAWPRESRPHDPDAVPGITPCSTYVTRTDPMVVVPHRAYLLFGGALADLDDTGSAALWPGEPGAGTSTPAFIWPADRAWCIAADVDPHWAGIGADAAAFDELVADPGLDVVRADPRAVLPRYR